MSPLILKMATRNIYLKASSLNSLTQGFRMYPGEDVLLYCQMVPPVDITGWTINMKIYTLLASGTSMGTIAAATIVDGPRGIFSFSLPSSLSSAAAVGRWVWDARRDDSGNVTTLMDGWLDLRQNLTT